MAVASKGDFTYYCIKCEMWIPLGYSEVHINECHKNQCSLLHPLIKDGHIIAQINIIENSKMKEKLNRKSQKQLNKGKWIICDEPDVIERMNFSFAEKFVFLNEMDLYNASIEAFSPISLQVHGTEAVFVAVPYDNQEVGTIRIYEKSLFNYFPICDQTPLLSVKKTYLKLEKNIRLKIPNDEDKAISQRCFEKDFAHEFNYGLPSVFKGSDILSIKMLDGHPCKVSVEIPESKMNLSSVNEEQILSNQMDFFSPSEAVLNSTLENLNISSKDEIHHIDKDILERFDESCLTENSFQTSTPKREESSMSMSSCMTEVKSKRKSKKKKQLKKADSFNISAIRECCTHRNFISKASNIEVLTMGHIRKEVHDSNKQEMYFKSNIFHNVKGILEEKIKSSYSKKNVHCLWNGILLCGYPGTGKTTLIKQIGIEMNIPANIVSLHGFSKVTSSNYIEDSFNEAVKCSPSLLLFDEIDSMCHQNRGKNEFTDKILKTFQKLKTLKDPVILIGTTSRPEILPQKLRQVGRFDKDIILNLPDEKMRSHIIWKLLHGMKHCLKREDVDMLGKKAFGYSPSDLKSALQNSWRHCILRCEIEKGEEGGNLNFELKLEDLEYGFEDIVPFFLRENYSAISEVQWSDIWGYEEVKTKLKRMVEAYVYGNSLRGVLLYGPPGCSKTMMVRALATETQFSFFPVKCSDMLSKYVGETEKSLCRLFEKAMLGSPSIVFMDEIDSLCSERSGKGTDNSVIPELLSLLQKCSKSGNVLVVGATNRPQALDEALLSPGCLELLLHIDLPNCSSRCAIWSGLLNDVPKLDININSLCSQSEGFSCAEICGIYQKAAHTLLELVCKGEMCGEKMCLTEEDILYYLLSTTPRTSQALLTSIQTFTLSRKNKL